MAVKVKYIGPQPKLTLGPNTITIGTIISEPPILVHELSQREDFEVLGQSQSKDIKSEKQAKKSSKKSTEVTEVAEASEENN